MIVIQTTKVSTKLRASPFDETAIESSYGITYEPSIDANEKPPPNKGTYERGFHRIRGYVYVTDNGIAEDLFAVTADIDLVVYYTNAAGEARKRTFADVLFVGRAVGTGGILRTESRPVASTILFGVPFVVQIPDNETIGDHVTDAAA